MRCVLLQCVNDVLKGVVGCVHQTVHCVKNTLKNCCNCQNKSKKC